MIASHPRIYGRYQEQIKLDHYLELLLQKSRALGNTKVYKPQMLAPVYEQYRRSLNARSPRGNREFVKNTHAAQGLPYGTGDRSY